MPVNIGTQIGQYEITALLGKGGMGEVYRARDLKLKRAVAVKTLPGEFSLDVDRIARFQREAEALAALNHTNIGAIYDLHEADGSQYLILELVEGETLADVLKKRGALPAAEVLKIAIQIGEALEAAHEKGVVHRDLKPANIKITPDGKVKVLDFGLAKAMEAPAANVNLSNSPTLSVMATNAGVILGTAAYMSPEQARGENVDHRSDVFSFGCVLYEMLTGRQAFQGEKSPDILAAILIRDPDWTALPPNLNRRFMELLRRSLEKSPKRRWQAIGDLRAELETIAAEPEVVPAAAPAAALRRPRWKTVVAVVGLALGFAALGSVATWSELGRSSAPAVVRFPFILPDGQQFTHISRRLVAVAPDGARIVYVANGQLFSRSANDMTPVAISGTSGSPSNPFFSSDGQWVGFWSAGTLKKIASTGGAALTICQTGDPSGVDWFGDQIVFANANGIFRVSARGGQPETLFQRRGEAAVGSPQFLNGGREILFSLSREPGPNRWDKAELVVHSMESGEDKVVLQGGSQGHYLSTGHMVYVLGATLLAVPFDLKTLEVRGNPVPLVEGMLQSTGFSVPSKDFAVSDTGTLVYVPGSDVNALTTLALVDQDGKTEGLGLPPQHYIYPRLSPNGQQIAVETDDGKEAIIWIYDLKTKGPLRRLTIGGNNSFPLWTPDSRYVTFQSDRDGDLAIFRQLADGSGAAERLTRPEQGHAQEPESWSPDGKVLAFDQAEGGNQGIWTVEPAADSKPKEFHDLKDSVQKHSDFSPDGHWIAFMSTELNRYSSQVFVKPFPPNDTTYQISTEAGRTPRWSADGKRLFYHDPNSNHLVMVDVHTQPSFTFGKPTVVPIEGTVHPQAQRNYDVTPDGKLLVVLPASSVTNGADASIARTPQINVVLNWFTELQQRVPVK